MNNNSLEYWDSKFYKTSDPRFDNSLYKSNIHYTDKFHNKKKSSKMSVTRTDKNFMIDEIF